MIGKLWLALGALIVVRQYHRKISGNGQWGVTLPTKYGHSDLYLFPTEVERDRFFSEQVKAYPEQAWPPHVENAMKSHAQVEKR